MLDSNESFSFLHKQKNRVLIIGKCKSSSYSLIKKTYFEFCRSYIAVIKYTRLTLCVYCNFPLYRLTVVTPEARTAQHN